MAQEYSEITIDKISYDNNKDFVELIDVVKIDNNLWGRIDILINRYYNGDMSLLPIILDFNEIQDITELKIGSLFKLPYINSLETEAKLKINDFSDDIIPGIIKRNTNKKFINNSKIKAMPKLNLELKKIIYNKNTGEVIY